jgi:hypothetical protein
VNAAMKNTLLSKRYVGVGFDDIFNSTHVSEWMFGNLVRDTANPAFYSGRPLTLDEKFHQATFNKMITNILFSSKKIQYKSNPSSRFDDFVRQSWAPYE